MLFKHPLSGLQVQYSASQVTAMKKKSAKVCLITEVNGCLEESDGLFQVYLKWLKRRLVDRLMVCAVKHVKHYTERPSGVNHHAFQCMFTLFTVFF